MEFFLAKEVESVEQGYEINAVDHDYTNLDMPPIMLEPCATMVKEKGKIYNDRLCSLFGINPAELGKRGRNIDLNLAAQIKPQVGVTQQEFAQGKGGEMIIWCGSDIYDDEEPPFFSKVFNKLKELEEESGNVSVFSAAVRVEVRFPDFQSDWNVYSKDFKIEVGSHYSHEATIELGVVPDTVTKAWITEGEMIRFIITVILVLNDEVANRLLVYNLMPSTPAFTLKTMLENENESDSEIIPRETEAKHVKCHRAVLAARSPVLQAMFRSGMKEGATNSIQIKDMGGKEVNAFIKYLYTWDLKAPLSDCSIALELLKAGNCYQVEDLCTTICELMLMKTDEWFSVDVTVDLLVFSVGVCRSASTSRNPSSTDGTRGNCSESRWMDLKLKAVQVLKWYSTQKPMDLINSDGYKDLHVKNPGIAMELHASFLRVLNMKAYRRSSVAP